MPKKPVVLAVDDEKEQLTRIEGELSSRYSRHYEIICELSADDAMRTLEALAEAHRDVALVLVDQWMPNSTGVEFLTTMAAIHPRTKRTLLIPWGAWGDEKTTETIVKAMTLGHIDYYVLKPWQSPDEFFHRTVTAFLHDWVRSQVPAAPLATVVGESLARRSYELRSLLSRYRVDHVFLKVGSHEAQQVLDRAGRAHSVLPVVALLDGRVLVNPSDTELAEALGLKTRLGEWNAFDVVIIGAGPAGLAAAVYGSSEGLRTLVVERQAIGGQAGSSSLIRNYLGFAKGVSGSELAQQAYQQAWVFGANFLLMRDAESIRRGPQGLVVALSDGEQATSSAVVLATGVSYRRLGVPALDELVGAGVFHGASAAEAQALEGRNVLVVGGGNSAGQAAMHLASYASTVTLLVRGDTLAESMSDYLIRKIGAAPNVYLRFNSQVVGGGGRGRLEYVVLQDAELSREETVQTTALFVLIGAKPYTDWLPEAIERDRWGFVLTGSDLLEAPQSPSSAPFLLETSMPGVFAAGDVRHGSVKRVASAVGEGAIATRLVHEYLERERLGRLSRAAR